MSKNEPIYFHVVFTVYRGKKALVGDIEAYFRELVEEIARKRGYNIFAIETMPNHVHLLLTKPPWGGSFQDGQESERRHCQKDLSTLSWSQTGYEEQPFLDERLSVCKA